jgi:hypothetical protein
LIGGIIAVPIPAAAGSGDSRPLRRTAWLLLAAAAVAGAGVPAPPNLDTVLRGLDRASYLYLDAALRFACDEKIVERNPGRRIAHRFEYLFVYDETHGFQDYRMVVRKGTREPANPTALGVGRFLERAYMWVLIFNRTRQPRHGYELLGFDKVRDLPALKVHFEPIPPFQKSINDWFGTAWVDPETFQILKVVARQAADEEEWRLLQHDREETIPDSNPGPARSYRVNVVTTEFTVVKNGMRFPGRAEIVSALYYLPHDRRSPEPQEISQGISEQFYSNYRFYGVRTSEEVREILTAKPSPPAPPTP